MRLSLFGPWQTEATASSPPQMVILHTLAACFSGVGLTNEVIKCIPLE